MRAQHIEDPEAYARATERRIKANAWTGRNRRWLAADASREALVARMREHVGLTYPPEVRAIFDSYADAGWGDILEEDLTPEEAKVIRDYRRNFHRRYVHPFIAKMVEAFDEWGSLTDGQERAVRQAFERLAEGDAQRAERRAEWAARDAASQHVGTAGERRDFTLTLQSVFEVETAYGLMVIHKLTDADGNIVVYKGQRLCRADFRPVEKGETITLKATVKAHDEYQGVKQTVVNRPKVA